MMTNIRNLSREIVETLSAQERKVIVLLYAEQLRVAEVSEMLEMPPERVIAIAALVQCRVRMAITGGLRDRAVALWDESMETPGHVGFPLATRSRRLHCRAALRARPAHAAPHRAHVRL